MKAGELKKLLEDVPDDELVYTPIRHLAYVEISTVSKQQTTYFNLMTRESKDYEVWVIQ